jgi:hypothetical protein
LTTIVTTTQEQLNAQEQHHHHHHHRITNLGQSRCCALVVIADATGRLPTATALAPLVLD